jgi:hypothetical protein
MADFSRIGRNNKNRGRAFERHVAEKLGWTRVPFSGAVRDWGVGDVMDGFYQRKGCWAAECKTQQPGVDGSISIKHKWVNQMYDACRDGRQGIIITKNVRSSRAWVFFLDDAWDWFHEITTPSLARIEASTYTRGKGHNFVVPGELLNECGDTKYIELGVHDKKANNVTPWYVISLNTFASLIHEHKLYVPEVKPDADQG